MARQAVALALVVLTLASALPLDLVRASGPPVGCSAAPGSSIQSAVDRAPPRSRVTICAGVYAEQVTIAKDGLELVALPGAILDGATLAGTRFGVTLAEGVKGLTITGLEIRNYADPVAASGADSSSGVFAQGRDSDVLLDNVDIHDNGFAGLLVLGAKNARFTITSSRVHDHRFADVLAVDTKTVTIRGSTFGSAAHEIVLAPPDHATIENDTFGGQGRSAITLTPRIGARGGASDVLVQRNTFSGTFTFGTWLAGIDRVTLRDNDYGSILGAIVSGGRHARVTASNNSARAAIDVEDATAIQDAFAGALAPAAFSAQAASVDVLECALSCPLEAIGRAFGAVNVQVGGTTSSTSTVASLVTWATTSGLDPTANATTTQDATALASCVGKNDSCLDAAFFDASSGPQHAWTISGPFPGLGAVQLCGTPTCLQSGTLPSGYPKLVFVDAGTRLDAEPRAQRLRTGVDLDQAWTTIVVCRLYLNATTALPCDLEPAGFDFGLDVTWAAGATAQGASTWRLHHPTSDVYASFDRIHSRDATLFRATTRPHSNESAPGVLSTSANAPTPLADPLRVGYNGSLTLRCAIDTGALGGLSACGAPTLVKDKETPALLWCASPIASSALDTHDNVLSEAASAWSASGTCGAMPTNANTSWAAAFSQADLTLLARAQVGYDAATGAERDARQADAERVLQRVLGEHLALDLAGIGMPRVVDPSALAGAVPTRMNATIPCPACASYGAGVAWDAAGGKAYLAGGSTMNGVPMSSVVVFDPALDRTSLLTPDGQLTAVVSPEVVWDGTSIDLLGGYASVRTPGACAPRQSVPVTLSDGVRSDLCIPASFQQEPIVQRVTPATGASTQLPAELNLTGAFPVVFDPRPASLRCMQGCAYVLGRPDAPGSVTKYDPALGTLTSVTDIEPAQAAAFMGDRIFIITTTGEFRSLSPSDGSVLVLPGALPAGLQNVRAVWDGRYVDILGGRSTVPGVDARAIRQYDPTTGTLVTYPAILPDQQDGGAAFSDGAFAYVLGGRGSTGAPTDKITRVPLLASGAGSALAGRASAFRVVQLAATSDARPNVHLVGTATNDTVRGWLPTTTPALTTLEHARVQFAIDYTALNGDAFTAPINVTLHDAAPELHVGAVVQRGSGTWVDVIATDPDDRDYAADYEPGTVRVHSLERVTLNSTTGSFARGLGSAGGLLPAGATNLTACATSWNTGRASGTEDNLQGTNLSVDAVGACQDLAGLAALLPRYQPDSSVTIEVRRSHDAASHASAIRVEGASSSTLRAPGNVTLADAAAYAPSPEARDVAPVAERIVLEIPAAYDLSQVATILGQLLDEHASAFHVLAVEIEGVPSTPILALSVERAVARYGTIVLAPAGTLPAGVRGWAPQDKLMTITGLAADPHVLTIGAATVAGGIAPWTRLGPSPALVAKPDFVAPSVPGSTSVSVANALPFVEALVGRGIRDPASVRATLLSLAVPVRGGSNAPATAWEQGGGLLDLASYVDASGVTLGSSAAPLGVELGADLTGASGRSILGLVADPSGLERASLARVLTTQTVAPPVVPVGIVDFAVVNNDLSASEPLRFVDPLAALMGSSGATRRAYEDSGVPPADAAAAMRRVSDMRNASLPTRDVTVDSVYYSLFDLLDKGDLLYTTYAAMLRALNTTAAMPPGADAANTSALIGKLSRWELPNGQPLLEPLHFTPAWSATPRGRPLAPPNAIGALSGSVRSVLGAEASAMAGTTHAAAAQAVLDDLDRATATLAQARVHGLPSGIAIRNASVDEQAATLGALRSALATMKALRVAPEGAYGASESQQGTWDATPLGRDLRNTSVELGIPLASLQGNGSSALDVTLLLVDATLARLTDPLDADAARQTQSEQTSVDVWTDRARTSTARLGPYVGFVTVTTHNVTTLDPLRNTTMVRDVTLPTLSLLFNDPTLTWREEFADSTPYANAGIGLINPWGGIFRGEAMDVNTTNASVRIDGHQVYVGPNATALLQREHADAAAYEAGLDQVTLPDDALLGDALASQLDFARKNASVWAERSQLGAPQSYLWRAFSSAISALYGHSTVDGNRTNANGEAVYRYLFPGVYGENAPYEYSASILADREIDPVNPGTGGFDSQMDDPAFVLGKQVNELALRLFRAPTADPDPPVSLTGNVSSHAGIVSYGATESQRPEPFAALNLFGAAISKVDALGVLCQDYRSLSDLTQTPFTFDGCGAIPSDLVGPAPLDAQDLARCVMGLQRDAASPTCATLRVALDAARASCDGDASRASSLGEQSLPAQANTSCAAHNALSAQLATLPLAAAALSDVRSTGSVPIPWVRSPKRVLDTAPERVLDRDYSIRRTQEIDPSLTYEAAGALVDQAFALAGSLLSGAVEITDPPRDGRFTHVLSPGVIHRTVDKVLGLDWSHVEPSLAVRPSPTDDQVLQELANATAYLDPGDTHRPALQAFHDALARAARTDPSLHDGDLARVFSAPFALPVAARTSSWWGADAPAPDGSLGSTGLHTSATQSSSGVSCSAQLASLLSVGAPPGFAPCKQVEAAVGHIGIQGLAGVDDVQLANALIRTLGRVPSERLPTLPSADLLTLLDQAVTGSVGNDGALWARTTDGIAVHGDPTNLTSVAGALVYETPIPINEIVAYDIDAEVATQNTAGVAIATANPLLGSALAALVDQLPPNVPHQDPKSIGTYSQVYQTLLDVSKYANEKTTSYQVFGVPLRAKASTPPSSFEAGHANNGPSTGLTSVLDGATSYEPATWAIDSGGYTSIHLHRAYGDRGEGDGFGYDKLWVVVLYLPALRADQLPGPDDATQHLQAFDLENTTIEIRTYIGVGGASHGGITYQYPSRFRPNVESWDGFFAEPDAKLATPGHEDGMVLLGAKQAPESIVRGTWDAGAHPDPDQLATGVTFDAPGICGSASGALTFPASPLSIVAPALHDGVTVGSPWSGVGELLRDSAESAFETLDGLLAQTPHRVDRADPIPDGVTSLCTLHNWLHTNRTTIMQAHGVEAVGAYRGDAAPSDYASDVETRVPWAAAHAQAAAPLEDASPQGLVVDMQGTLDQTYRQSMRSDGGILETQQTTRHATLTVQNGLTSVGVALDLVRSQDSLQVFLPDGRASSSPATRLAPSYQVHLYGLGGVRTAGSDCARIPGYERTAALVRCTGYTLPDVVAPAGATSACAAQVEPLFGLIAGVTGNATAPGVLPPDVMRLFAGPTPARTDATLADVTAKRVALGGALNGTASLLACLAARGVDVLPQRAAPYDAILREARAAFENATLTDAASDIAGHARNFTLLARPDVVDDARPPIDLDVIVPGLAAQALNATGIANYSYAITQWYANATSGTLNVSKQGAGIVSSQAIPAPFSGPTLVVPGAAPVRDGDVVTLDLRVLDQAGRATTTSKTFLVDASAPSLASALPPESFTRATSVDVPWTVQDAGSGLRSVTTQGPGGATTWPIGDDARATMTLHQLVDVGALASGQTATVSLTATDLAGNSATLTRRVSRDLSAPTVSLANYTDNVSGVVSVPHLRYLVQASDQPSAGAHSGIARMDAYLVNHSSHARTLVRTLVPTAPAGAVSLVDDLSVWPNTTYHVDVTITDAVGNTLERSLPNVTVQLVPTIREVYPRIAYSSASGVVRLAQTSTLPMGAPLDEARIEIDGTPVASDATGGMPSFDWNTSSAPTGEHKVSFYARSGRAAVYKNATVNVVDPGTNVTSVHEHVMSGTLAGGSGNVRVYAYKYGAGGDQPCAGAFTLTLRATAANATDWHDVDLHTNAGSPADATNWTQYHNASATATGADEVLTTSHAAIDQTFYVLVRQRDATASTFSLVLDDGCQHASRSGWSSADTAPPLAAVVSW